MNKFPCIICESGDPYSNQICENCEENLEHRKEVYESMISLVHDNNNISGDVPLDLCNKIEKAVKPIYQMLIHIKIEDTRKINVD